MIGVGTLINTAAILVGGVLGLLFGRFLNRGTQDSLTKACGVGTLFLAISGVLDNMNAISENAALLIVGCLLLGTLSGELLRIEDGFEKLGVWLRNKTGNGKDSSFVDAFVTASFTVCIGAMAIVGAIQDGILGDPSILITKSVLDLVIIMAMTASLGKGAIFSAIPVAMLQGSVTLLAGVLKGLLTDSAMIHLGLVGNILIFCVGINLLFGKTIKVANMLPAIVFAIAAAWIF